MESATKRISAGSSPPIPHGYIGIDFGTSNSHFAYCNTDGALVAEPICLDGKEKSVLTCVLWKEPASEDSDIVTFGAEAVEEWANRDASERAGFRFAAGFKPDIAVSERARRDAQAFLRQALLAIRDKGVVRAIGRDEGMPVVVGVPAEIGPEHRRITALVAQAAGFGEVTCIEEPLGALAYHLSHNDITAAEARLGVVVVDFGGGTLDVALLDQHGLRDPWGDPTLGGRLFDDLFFQWLLEQNPNKRIDPRDVMFVWQVTCRELKEDFSRRWARMGPTSDFRKNILVGEGNWFFKHASVDEFRRRAENYQPSSVAQDYFRALGNDLSRLGSGGPVNLFDWIRRTMARSNSGGQIPDRFARVLLTGGSSEWPFMKDLAAEIFRVDPKQIIRSGSPELTIGSGLAIYNVLSRRYEVACAALRREAPARRKSFDSAVAKTISEFARAVARDIVDPLMDQVQELFLNWRLQGGSLDEVETKVESMCSAVDVRGVVERHSRNLLENLLRVLREHLRRWLLEHNIEREVDQFVPAQFDLSMRGGEPLGNTADSIAQDIAKGVGAALAAVVAGIILLIQANLHAAWFLADFLGATIALLAGILVKYSKFPFKEKITDRASDFVAKKVKAHQWGSLPLHADLKVLQGLISQDRIKLKLFESRTKATADLTAQIEARMVELRDTVAAKFEAVIEQVIEDLGFLDRVRTKDG
jgi:molecular chaperone DnaK